MQENAAAGRRVPGHVRTGLDCVQKEAIAYLCAKCNRSLSILIM